MKIVSGRARWAGLLKRIQVVKFNARRITRGSFVTAEGLAVLAEANAAIKKIDELQDKLLSWTEAVNYMQMSKYYVRQDAGGAEIAELEEFAVRRTEKIAKELKTAANALSQLVMDYTSKHDVGKHHDRAN